jgi:CRISPR system Cascade subunit CasB
VNTLTPTEAADATLGLKQAVGRIAHIIGAADFPTGERANLKRQDPNRPPSLTFYRFAFRYLPEGWERKKAAWMTLITGIALMGTGAHRPDRPVGQALAENRYAESRLERLLAAEGATLHTLLLRAVRFLAAKNEGCNWADWADLLLTSNDTEKEKVRRKFAKSYYDK